MNYVSLDGGGTKLNAIWFDEKLALKGRARAMGVNWTVTPRPEYMLQIRACFDELFAGGAPTEIDTMYVICGQSADFIECLMPATRVNNIVELGECLGGLLAGRLITEGAVVIAGTGSNSIIHSGGNHAANGGWGAILGDEGSGVWISRQAMQAAVRNECGWGEYTVLSEMVKREYGFTRLNELVKYLYASPAPFQRLGSLLPLVAKAANMGDRVSVDAFTRGADMLSRQILALIDKYPGTDPDIVACGGAWKAWPGMFEAFTRFIRDKRPGARVYLPWFEHVLAGPAKLLLDNGLSAERARQALLDAFPDYEWRA